MAYELISFPNDDALVVAAAERWLKMLSARQDSGRPYTVALSGGRVTQKFFAAVATNAPKECFRNVHFFWADERCVPPDHADSNYRVAEAELLRPLNIPGDQIHRLKGELDPLEGARLAAQELAEVTGAPPESLPKIDLVFLGMGEDGHIASLFPGDDAASDPAWFRPVIGPKPPPQRLTMGYGLLAQAGEVWVLASGKAKEEALKESLQETGRTPLARVLSARRSTLILSDISLPQ